MMDLGSIKKDFSALLSQVQPWTLSHFVMWLDIKVAEYKVFGRMIMDNTPGDTPQWLRASADYLEQQHKEAQAAAVFAPEAGQEDKDLSAQPPLSPRSATAAALRSTLNIQGMPVNQAMTTLTTSVSSLYTASTVTTTSTVVSPSVSPAGYVGVAQISAPPPPPVDTFQKQHVPISSPDTFLKSAAVPSQFQAFQPGTQRIPPISHLSPKHIRQSHMDQNLSMSLPVSMAPLARNKEATKESLSTAEVESQIALLESQIAAVNRSLKQTSQITGVEPILQTPLPTTKHGRRKADSSSEDQNNYGPPPYPKKTRQQSPVSANRTSVESTSLPPLHSSMDMLARIHRLDTDSIPESLRSQNIQSTLEAFEALRTQTFPPNTEVIRPQVSNDVETMQNTAQDMSMHHIASEREQQLLAFSAAAGAAVTSEREQVYPVTVTPAAALREQTSYTPSPTEREAVNNATFTAPTQGSSVHVKVEAGQSDEDSVGEGHNLSAEEIAMHQAALQNAHDHSSDQTYPVSMYTAATNESATADDKLAAEISTKKMRRKFLESMKNSNPKYYSHQIQQIIPFPEKFPVANLDYGLKALQMIQTGEITRAGKIQLIDTIFHELIKYTGLYPTPTQKMSVANAIVETFPTLAAKMKASHISPADSWYVILCDKFRNERRGLSGSPRVGRSPKVAKHEHDPSADQPPSVEPTEEVEIRTTEEEMADDSSQPMAPTPPSSVSQQATSPLQHHNQQAYAAESAAAVAAVAAYHQAYTASQQLQLEDGLVLNSASTTSAKEHVLPEMTSEEEEDMGENERLVNMMNAEERKLYSWKAKRSVRRKTHSPKRVQKAEMPPILDERYAASLLEYYSKHKPYYTGVDGDLSKAMDVENWKGDAGLVIDEKGGMSVPSTSQALAQAITSHAVGNPDEPYSAEVAAIVQSVVSAHMDEMLAARNYQVAGPQPGPQAQESPYPILNQPQEVEGTVEVKTSKKKPKPQPIKTPEQLQVTMQRFKQKLGVTYPGVQVVDDCTLLCTCGTKVKLGRARMLHNYTNYHLKRCQNPPSTVHLDSHSPSSLTPGSIHSMYMGSPGEINIPTTGPKVITKEVENVAFSGLSAADKETIQKHFLLNIPVPSSDVHSIGSASSVHDSQSLDLTMPVTACHTPMVVSSEGSDVSVSVSHHHHAQHPSSEPSTPQPTRLTGDQNVLTITNTGQNHLTLNTNNLQSVGEARPASAPVTVSSLMGDSQSLDLSVQTSGPSVLIEHQPGSDLRVQIPGSIATSIVEYSGELPDLSAMNALALIQGKVDQPTESGTMTTEEPMNLADS